MDPGCPSGGPGPVIRTVRYPAIVVGAEMGSRSRDRLPLVGGTFRRRRRPGLRRAVGRLGRRHGGARRGRAHQRRQPAPRRTAGRCWNEPGTSLLPGLIDAHTHVLLRSSYDEFELARQMVEENLGHRAASAVQAMSISVRHGFTTIRDLGTEGAGYLDVGLRDAAREGMVPGPADAGRRARHPVDRPLSAARRAAQHDVPGRH